MRHKGGRLNKFSFWALHRRQPLGISTHVLKIQNAQVPVHNKGLCFGCSNSRSTVTPVPTSPHSSTFCISCSRDARIERHAHCSALPALLHLFPFHACFNPCKANFMPSWSIVYYIWDANSLVRRLFKGRYCVSVFFQKHSQDCYTSTVPLKKEEKKSHWHNFKMGKIILNNTYTENEVSEIRYALELWVKQTGTKMMISLFPVQILQCLCQIQRRSPKTCLTAEWCCFRGLCLNVASGNMELISPKAPGWSHTRFGACLTFL